MPIPNRQILIAWWQNPANVPPFTLAGGGSYSLRYPSALGWWGNVSPVSNDISISINEKSEPTIFLWGPNGSFSDIRLKENIEAIPEAIQKVQKLEGVTFNYKKDGSRSTGLIAQQLQEVLPEVVYETKDLDTQETHYAVRYGNVVGLLVEAIKEQQTQLNSQQEQINQLTNLVNALMEK